MEHLLTDTAKELLQKARDGTLRLNKMINELKEGDEHITLDNLRIKYVYPVRPFSKGMYRKIDVEDKTGVIKLLLFDEQIDRFKNIKDDDIITLRNVGYKNGTIRLSDFSTVEVVLSTSIMPMFMPEQDGHVNVHGTLNLDDSGAYLEYKGKRVKINGGLENIDDGNKIALTKVLYKNGEFHIDKSTRVFVKKTNQ
jgi:hypothetical protein